jgi:hypothetical protein
MEVHIKAVAAGNVTTEDTEKAQRFTERGREVWNQGETSILCGEGNGTTEDTARRSRNQSQRPGAGGGAGAGAGKATKIFAPRQELTD